MHAYRNISEISMVNRHISRSRFRFIRYKVTSVKTLGTYFRHIFLGTFRHTVCRMSACVGASVFHVGPVLPRLLLFRVIFRARPLRGFHVGTDRIPNQLQLGVLPLLFVWLEFLVQILHRNFRISKKIISSTIIVQLDAVHFKSYCYRHESFRYV